MANKAKVYNLYVTPGTDFEDADNMADIKEDTGGAATYCKIKNSTDSSIVEVRLNRDNDAIFFLEGGETQEFRRGDLLISHVSIANSISGGINTAIEIIIGV
jgi:hypothetical protein